MPWRASRSGTNVWTVRPEVLAQRLVADEEEERSLRMGPPKLAAELVALELGLARRRSKKLRASRLSLRWNS